MLRTWFEAFEQGTDLTEEGRVKYQRLDFRELFEILPDAFHVTPQLDPAEVRTALRSAVLKCRKEGRLTASLVMEEANVLIGRRLQRNPSPFSMWTKLRARQAAFNKGFQVEYDEVRIRSVAYLPSYMQVNEFTMGGHGTVHPDKPSFFGHVIARTGARNEEIALRRMLKSLQVVMGLWNVVMLYGTWSHPLAKRVTEGKLWAGPYYFVYRGRKFLGHETLWWNPDYDEEAWNTFPPDMADVLRRSSNLRWSLKQLAAHSFREVLERTITLMQNGLASTDANHRLLRYWSAIENLYSEKNARQKNYDRIIKRAAFAETEQTLSRWKLQHASLLRNEYVHAEGKDEDLQAICQFLRDLLWRHIIYLLKNPDRFASHEQFLEFVELPREIDDLTTLKELVELRIRMAENAPDPSSAYGELAPAPPLS